METKKFATTFQKNNHKIVVILVYAFLEWILIFLLLLNSLFSYLIEKFAKHFGLKPPCICCTRSLNHILDPNHRKNSHLENLCEAHGIEISSLSYCFTHRRLVESRSMCSNCPFSQPIHGDQNTSPITAFFTKVSQNISQNDEEGNIQYCSCCEEILTKRNMNPPLQLFKDSWDFLEYIKKRAYTFDLIGEEYKTEEMRYEENEGYFGQKQLMPCTDFSLEALLDEDGSSSSSSSDILCSLRNTSLTYPLGGGHDLFPCSNGDDESFCIVEKLLENTDYADSERFICIELIDTDNNNNQVSSLTQIFEGVHEEIETTLVEDEPESLNEGEATKRYERLEISYEDKHGISTSRIEDCDIENKDSHISKESILGLDFLTPAIEDDKSEKNNSESLMTEEHLLWLLRAQQKAFEELYEELEEERKVAKETMEMVIKLQEEKDSIQTEALQYQRMMEEQAEYDQEAMQLLNDLMKKREREKHELEKELEIYREKVFDYESREDMTMLRRSTTSSISSLCDIISRSHEDHSIDEKIELENVNDGLEDLEEEEEMRLTLPDISLAEFDQERLCILEELKALEAKLFEDVKSIDSRIKENLDLENKDLNGFSSFGVKKRLLPLFDEECIEEEGIIKGIDIEKKGPSSSSSLSMEEELGYMYGRLQALEDDKEFIKQYMCSMMMNGNKGHILVQEILRLLRDLRAVEISYGKIRLQTKRRYDEG